MFAPKIARGGTKTPASAAHPLVSRGSTRTRLVLQPDAETLAGETLSDLSWDFGKARVFSPDPAIGPRPEPRLIAAGGLQAKLMVGQANDPLEHEADRMADRVMSMAAAALPLRRGSPQISRKCAASEIEEKTLRGNPSAAPAGEGRAPSIVNDALQSPGKPLDSASRNFFESRFGHDFSNVRLHTDAQAEKAAESIGARAFTLGPNIVFGAQNYAPQSDSGRHLIAHELAHVLQQGSRRTRLQRQPTPVVKPKATPVPPPGGNILYIGLHNFPLELAALHKLYKSKPVNITEVTLATDEAHTVSNGKVFDLTNDAGVDTFAASLGLDKTKTQSAAALIKNNSQMRDRDDMAHVMAEYAKTELDGQDRMSRVVLSGHSFGHEITDDVFTTTNNFIHFEYLVELAKLFPKAAAQTKHLYVSACFTGVEDNIRDFYQRAFPNLVTFSGWTNSCPTDKGAAAAMSEWAKTTDADPTTLAKPPEGRSAWSSGVYQGNEKSDPADTMRILRSDEAKFMDYFNGLKVDPDSHRGWLATYYGQARTADLRSASITGSDHVYAHLHAEQALRLRFWTDQAAKFWKVNEAKIRAGYGTTAVPNFGKLSRKEALKAIAKFPSEAKGSAADQAEALKLLEALKNLDEKMLPA